MDPHNDLLFVDIETASLADLKEVGAWVYSKHPSTHVYCLSACFGSGGPAGTWFPVFRGVVGRLQPAAREFILAGGQVVAHNVSFERSVWENILVPRYDFPVVEPWQWRDTQAMGLALNLPKSLDGLASILTVPLQKDLEGALVMKKMASKVEPITSGGYSYPLATDENLIRLGAYCEQDVLVTRACYYKMTANVAPMSLFEERLWQADLEINSRGVYLDREFATRCKEMAEQRQTQLDRRMFMLTVGELASASAPPKMKTYLQERDVELPLRPRGKGKKSPSLDAAAVESLLAGDTLNPDVRRVLELRQEAAKATSLAKLNRVHTMTDPDDGRLRNALQFCGAHTARWASYGLQLHNLPKVGLSPGELQLARRLVEQGSMELMALAFSQPLAVLSQLLRSIVSAPPGKELIAGDYSAIEARVVAWLAGQDDIVDLFARGEDVYTYAAERQGSDNRQMGKVSTLMLGFQAGPLRFAQTAADWGVPISLKESRRLVEAWRENNSFIRAFWKDLEDAAKAAVNDPGTTHKAGRIECYRDPSCLHLFLPSGRSIRYWNPHIRKTKKKVKVVTKEGEIDELEFETQELRFYMPARGGIAMQREHTFGGKLVENVTQATARELLANSILELRDTDPYEVVTHVHDSACCEVPAGEGDVAEFCAIMERTPKWADGLPIKVEGYRDTRFRG